MLRPTYAAILGVAALCGLALPASAAGLLVPRDGSPPIEVRSQRVTAHVEDGLARTTVRQTFVNPHQRQLEAVYVFPVPEGATLVDVAMEVGGQRLEGLVVERQKARRVYDSIVRRKQDPALVEQIGRSTFRLSVFPIVKNAPTVVELTWIEQLPLTGGKYRYVYPLALAGGTTKTKQDLTLTVNVKSSAPIVSASSPIADMDVRLRGRHEVIASMERTGASLNEDLVVETAVRSVEASLAVKTFRDARGNGYFAAIVTPPEFARELRIPRDITLLLDTSGSMRGAKIEQAKRAARYLVEHAHADDRVNIVTFSSAVDALAERPLPMTDKNRTVLAGAIDAIDAAGGTALGDAVALARTLPAAPGRVQTVVLLTDGRPTAGETDPAKIIGTAREAGTRGVRMHVFGVGADVQPQLLEGIATASSGSSEVFRPGGEIATRLSRFLRRTSSPAMANLAITADGVAIRDIQPRPLPVVYFGEQAVVTGRFRGHGPADVVVSGRLGNRDVTLHARADFVEKPAGSVAVRDLWAHRKIDFLESALRLRSGLSDDAYYAALERGQYSTSDEIVAEIVDTSIDCGVQSPYASFLVLLPEDRRRLDPRDLAALEAARERAAAARGKSLPTASEEKPIEEIEKHAKVDDTAGLGDPRFNSDAPFEGPGTNGTIGIGGGAGASFGGRRGGRRSLRAGGGGRKTQSAVDLGLEWLKATQDASGAYRAADGSASPGVTGLALLTFLAAGETHNSGQYKVNVGIGIRYLKSVQSSDGWFGVRGSTRARFDHSRAALAMVEAYGLTGSRLFKDPAQRGVGAIHAARPAALWASARTETEREDAMWMTLTLRSAKQAELQIDAGALTRCANAARATLAAPAGTNSLRTTAHALMMLLFADPSASDEPATLRAADTLLAAPPAWDDGAIDPAYLHAATYALFQLGGDRWKRWNASLKRAVADHQVVDKHAPDYGAWRVAEHRRPRGVTEASVLLQMTLQVYYRYGRILGSSR